MNHHDNIVISYLVTNVAAGTVVVSVCVDRLGLWPFKPGCWVYVYSDYLCRLRAFMQPNHIIEPTTYTQGSIILTPGVSIIASAYVIHYTFSCNENTACGVSFYVFLHRHPTEVKRSWCAQACWELSIGGSTTRGGVSFASTEADEV